MNKNQAYEKFRKTLIDADKSKSHANIKRMLNAIIEMQRSQMKEIIKSTFNPPHSKKLKPPVVRALEPSTMVTLEQIRQLDAKVAKAVELINQLRMENTALTEKLKNYQQRIDELEVLINDFKESQGEIEEGILHALSELDKLDHSISPEQPPEIKAPSEESAVEPPHVGEAVSSDEDLGAETEDEAYDEASDEPKTDSELDIF